MSDEKPCKKIGKIEEYLHTELGYKPDIDTPDTEGRMWKVLNRLHKVVKGGDNIMGIETKVKIMWWANYVIGFACGSFTTMLVQRLLK